VSINSDNWLEYGSVSDGTEAEFFNTCDKVATFEVHDKNKINTEKDMRV
jgi:hypothetical protein